MASATASTPEGCITPFILLVSDNSPLINYNPNILNGTDPAESWITQLTDVAGTLSDPHSQHVTMVEGATLTLQFQGTSISLFGTSNGSPFDIVLDGAVSNGTEQDNLLARFDNLPFVNHTIGLTIHPLSPDAPFTFDYANITTCVAPNNRQLRNVTGVTTTELDDTQIQLTGRWNFHIEPTIPNKFMSFHATNHTGDFMSLNFTGTAIEIYGITDVDNGHYNVTLDGNTVTYDGQASIRSNALLFLQSGLDPIAEHQLLVTNVEEEKLLILTVVNITSVTGNNIPLLMGLRSTQLPPAGIAGVIIGALVVLVAVIFVGVCFVRRRHRSYDDPSSRREHTRATDHLFPSRTLLAYSVSIDPPQQVPRSPSVIDIHRSRPTSHASRSTSSRNRSIARTRSREQIATLELPRDYEATPFYIDFGRFGVDFDNNDADADQDNDVMSPEEPWDIKKYLKAPSRPLSVELHPDPLDDPPPLGRPLKPNSPLDRDTRLTGISMPPPSASQSFTQMSDSRIPFTPRSSIAPASSTSPSSASNLFRGNNPLTIYISRASFAPPLSPPLVHSPSQLDDVPASPRSSNMNLSRRASGRSVPATLSTLAFGSTSRSSEESRASQRTRSSDSVAPAENSSPVATSPSRAISSPLRVSFGPRQGSPPPPSGP